MIFIKREALGESSSLGKSRIPAFSLIAAAPLAYVRVASAGSEEQTFRWSPARFLPDPYTRGAEHSECPGPACGGRRSPCLRRKRFRNLSYISEPAHMCRFRAKRSFLLDRARPVFFSARPKRKWGAHCCRQHGGIPARAINIAYYIALNS